MRIPLVHRAVYRHRVQPLPLLALTASFVCAPIHRAAFPLFAWESGRYWATFAGLAALLLAWYRSRSLVVSDRGIQVRALFTVPYVFVPWAAMEEWTTFVPPPGLTRRSAVPPGPFARWLWGISGPGIRVIVRGEESLVFFPGELVGGGEIEQALRERGIPFR